MVLLRRRPRDENDENDGTAKATPNGSFAKLELLNGVSKSRLSQ
jgi:hypothetical protein